MSLAPSSLGLHIVDPRVLSDQVGDCNDRHDDLTSSSPSALPISLSVPPRLSSRPSTTASSSASSSSSLSQDNLYSNLATFTFGEAHTSDSTYSSSYESDDESPDVISPLTPCFRPGADRTPRPSVSTSASPKHYSSHPSQGPGRPASNPFPSSSGPVIAIRSSDTDLTDEESSEVPSPPDLIPRRGYPHRNRFTSDNASQYTFGTFGHLPVRSSIASSHSRGSSRASSRDGLEFSSDEEVEIGYYDGGSSPVTFTRDLDNIDEDAAPAFRHPLFENRRGSIPMTIPGSSSDAFSNRSREGSIHTIRRPSRSLDDDLASHMSSHSGEDPATVVPRSGPLTRADFRSLEVQVTQQQQQQQQLENSSTERSGAWDGMDLPYVLSRQREGSIRSLRSTAQLSFVSPGRGTTGEPSSWRPPNSWLGSGRRTSTITLQTNGSGEDTFTKHVGLYGYGSNSDHWSFLKEKADGPSVSISSGRHGRSSSLALSPAVVDKGKQAMLPGVQEIWRCGHVGRYRVDRLAFKPPSADPAKAAQQRINIRHIADPYLKGTKTGGPSSVIHRHSRAIAFSIFRSYTLFQSKHGKPSLRNTHMHTSGGIMLAPKKVQEQYTSTKTTSKLSTHGLLEDSSRKSSGSADKSNSRRGKEKEKEDTKKTKSKDKKKDKERKNERTGYPMESTESSTATSSTGSVDITTSQIISSPISKITFSPSPRMIVNLQPVSGPSSPEVSTPDHSSKKLIDDDDSPASIVNPVRGHRDSIDSYEHLPTRTPHAEAFGTLDPNDIEHLRRAQKPSDGSSSIANRIRRLLGGPSRPDSSGSLPAVPSQNAYSPPWIVTAGRDQNEEHVRVLTDLNNSFRDVGLLHTQPHKTGMKSSPKRRIGHDIFDYVPEDSLYMLLPLWAGETDPSMNPPTQVATLPTIPEDRQYLLVWYVPFEGKGKKSEQQTLTNTKKKKQTNSGDSLNDTQQKCLYLSNFQVNARVVGYGDLRGTGIRVPSVGLAITAPAWEAVNCNMEVVRGITDLGDTIICVCSSREKGFQLQSEGLTKLGLCLQEEIPLAPPSATPYSLEYEDREVEQFLTPIGRAAVEMMWLGCLAITSFGSV